MSELMTFNFNNRSISCTIVDGNPWFRATYWHLGGFLFFGVGQIWQEAFPAVGGGKRGHHVLYLLICLRIAALLCSAHRSFFHHGCGTFLATEARMRPASAWRAPAHPFSRVRPTTVCAGPLRK